MKRPVAQRVRRKSEVRSILAGFGLGPGRFSRSAASPIQRKPKERRLRLALEELGGIYAAFGVFLASRADLLPGPFLQDLQRIEGPLLASETVDPTSGFPGVDGLRPVGHSLFCQIFEGSYEGSTVVLEAFGSPRDRLSEKDWGRFRRGISLLADDPLTAKVAWRQVVDEFQNWLELEGDIERKRRLLGNLQDLPDSCITRFPQLVASLQTDRILTYKKLDGIPLALEASGSESSEKRLQAVVEAFLEQSLLLSAIPLLSSLDRLVLIEGEQIGFEICPALDSVPAECNYQLLQYLTSAVAGDRSRAIQMLSSLVDELGSAGSEPKLWQELSAQAEELEARSPFPESVNVLNTYSRALTDAGLKRPRFLEMFHRNVVLLGQGNAIVCPGNDLFAESIWPVLGRLMRYQLSQGLSADRLKEWVVGSGLGVLGASRQMSIILEQLRLNDLSMMISAQPVQGTGGGPRHGNWMIAVLTLVLFFISLQLAFAATHTSLGMIAGVLSVVMGLGLFIHLMRLN